MNLFSTRWLLVVTCLLLLLGCDKKEVALSTDTGPHVRLKKSVYSFSTGTSTTTYYYNSSNKVDYYENETRVPSEGRFDRGTLYCFYNTHNQLSKTEFRRGTLTDVTKYTYDAQGDLVLAEYFYGLYVNEPTDRSMTKRTAYKYANHVPVEETETTLGVYPNPVNQYRYTYDQGNVSRVDATLSDGSKSTTRVCFE